MNTYSLPLLCCSCLEPYETFYTVKRVDSAPPNKITTTLDVPVCKKCDQKMKRTLIIRRVIQLSIIILSMIIGSEIASFRNEDTFAYKFVGILIGIAVGFIVSEIYMSYTFPVELGSTFVRFNNKEYQRLFEELNPK